MNTIEQMYKEYIGEPECQLRKRGGFCSGFSCDFCRENSYPPFTAEKQIELLQLLAKGFEKDDDREFGLIFSNFDNFIFSFNPRFFKDQEHYDYELARAENIKFEEALADLIIKAKKYIDNDVVKEILEG